MIAKVIPAKAKSRTFGQLADYVAADNHLERPRGREFDDLVRYVGQENVVDLSTGEVIAKAVSIETQGVASLRTAAVEMEAVAARADLRDVTALPQTARNSVALVADIV